MTLKEWMKEAKMESENGKSFMQLSIETYLTKQLGFQLLETTLINKGYEDEFRFVVTNGVNEYVFENQYYEPQAFAPYQQVLLLKEIRGKEGVLTTDHMIWLMNNNEKDKFLCTPLSELMSGTQNDQELQYVVAYLTNAFKEMDGYAYKEEEANDLNSFVLSLNEQMTVRKAFSNTIQVDFNKERLTSIQIVFKEREITALQSELDDFIRFAHAYVEKNITLDQHNVSSLYQFLAEANLRPKLYTSTILSAKKIDRIPLFQPLVIETDDMFSYHQVETSIDYLTENKSFLIETNYLFRTFVTECASVEDVKKEVKELMHLVQTAD